MKNGEIENKAEALKFERERLVVHLADGRDVSVPLELYPSLLAADRKSRTTFRIIADGTIIHWPTLDLDLETEQLVLGLPERFPAPPAIRDMSQEYSVEKKSDGWAVVCRTTITVNQFRNKREAVAAVKQRHNCKASAAKNHPTPAPQMTRVSRDRR